MRNQYRNIIWIFIFGLAWAVFWWLSNIDAYNAIDLLKENGSLWFIPHFSDFLVKFAIVEMVVFISMLFAGFISKKFSISSIDIRPYFPSLILFAYLLQFLPSENRVIGFPNFLIHDLRFFLPVITLVTIFWLRFRDTLGKIYRRIESGINSVSIGRLSKIIFFSAFVIYCIFSLLLVHPNTAKMKRHYLLTGDEPQYLLITHSLVADKDINLYNNVENCDSLVYCDRVENGFSGGLELFGAYAKANSITAQKEYWINKRYSNLNIGLPLLISPFYFAGMLWDHQVRLCVLLFLNLLTALFVLNIFLLANNFTKNKFSSFLSVVFISLSGPILFYSRHIYPDMPAALLILFSFRKVYEKDFNSLWKAFLISLCISFLPWLHEKYVLVMLLLFVFFLVTCWKQKYKCKPLVFFIPFIVSVVFQVKYYYMLFGVPYPINVHPSFYLLKFHEGAVGLLFDEAHGLFPYTPLYAISIIGIVFYILHRRNKSSNGIDYDNLFWMLIFPFSFFFAASCFKEWPAGLCPAGRYLMPVVPFLVPFISYAYSNIKGVYFKSLFFGLAFLGLVIGIAGMLVPGRLFCHKHPFIPYLNTINLKGIFPDIFMPDINQYKLAIEWCLVIVLLVIFIVWMSSKKIVNKFNSYQNKWIFGYVFILIFLFAVNLIKLDVSYLLSNTAKFKIYDMLGTDKYNILFKKQDSGYLLIKDKKSIGNNLKIEYKPEEMLTLIDNKIYDSEAYNKIAVFGSVQKTKPGYIVYGPYMQFPKGRFAAEFRLKTNNNSKGSAIVIIDIASNSGKNVYCRKEIMGYDFERSNQYQSFVLDFNINNSVKDVEFRVYFTGKEDIWIDNVMVRLLL
jgi:hypothetical protein